MRLLGLITVLGLSVEGERVLKEMFKFYCQSNALIKRDFETSLEKFSKKKVKKLLKLKRAFKKSPTNLVTDFSSRSYFCYKTLSILLNQKHLSSKLFGKVASTFGRFYLDFEFFSFFFFSFFTFILISKY